MNTKHAPSKYFGLQTHDSKSKYTLSQRAKIGRILEKLNKRLLDNETLSANGPFKYKDIRKALSELSIKLCTNDVDILLIKLEEILRNNNYTSLN